MQDIFDQARRIRLVIFDVDGVLTDGSIYIGDDGQEYKAFYSRDGHGMKMLQRTGVTLAVITGRISEVVRIRMKSLGVEHVYQGQLDKLRAYEDLKDFMGLSDEEIAYVGDDLMDLPIMRRVGLSVAVADAHTLARHHSHWQTQSAGGRGAAREVCELIMEAQGTLDEITSSYL
jgi:3-deoxy-D-manno-octulosonate 8-phosphate phosphatase (KDO 8-P phosphatase)